MLRAGHRHTREASGRAPLSAAVDGPRDHVDEPSGNDPGSGGAGIEPRSGPSAPRPDLRAALRTARVEDAERSRAVADVHALELARLETLQEKLAPVLAQIPADVDLFDAALMPGLRPRLFIDMIGFVEMAHDRRRYRFVQDRRDGRVVLCESERHDVVVDAVTAYIARRLVEREKALASADGVPRASARAATAAPGLRRAGRLALEYLGIASLVVLLWVLGNALYQWGGRR